MLFRSEGMNYAKAVYIISDNAEELSKELMRELDRGATGIPVKGMYQGKDRWMLFCIIGKKQIVRLKEIVVKTDPQAFLIVTDAREVLGEGFIENYGL